MQQHKNRYRNRTQLIGISVVINILQGIIEKQVRHPTFRLTNE